jgi:hypothetical protein
MSLLNPAALFLLLIALPITLLYVLRVRLRRVPVSSLMFWQKRWRISLRGRSGSDSGILPAGL